MYLPPQPQPGVPADPPINPLRPSAPCIPHLGLRKRENNERGTLVSSQVGQRRRLLAEILIISLSVERGQENATPTLRGPSHSLRLTLCPTPSPRPNLDILSKISCPSIILTVVQQLVVVLHRSAVNTALGLMTRSHTFEQRYRVRLRLFRPSSPILETVMKIVIEAMPPREMKICKQRGRVYVCTLSVSIDGATQQSLLRLCMNRKYVSINFRAIAVCMRMQLKQSFVIFAIVRAGTMDDIFILYPIKPSA